MSGILDEIVNRLVTAYHPEEIYLFGSQARGDAGPDSDYDILVVVKDDPAADGTDPALAYRALRGTGAAADVIVMTRQQFQRRTHLSASLPAIVLCEGKLLYAA